MTQINTLPSLVDDLVELGVRPHVTVMVHSSLRQIGWTVGGPVTVIRALLEVIGPEGTLVMPAESPQMSDPADWDDDRVKPEWFDTIREHLPVFDPETTPTTMGAIAEAFRTYPGTRRSNHPLVSVCANGDRAEQITAEQSLEFCEGRGTPFEKLYDLDAHTLLLGVGFNRCTSLHYAESLVPGRRTSPSRSPSSRMAGACGWRNPTWRRMVASTFRWSARDSLRQVACEPARSVVRTACCSRPASWWILQKAISARCCDNHERQLLESRGRACPTGSVQSYGVRAHRHRVDFPFRSSGCSTRWFCAHHHGGAGGSGLREHCRPLEGAWSRSDKHREADHIHGCRTRR